MTRKTHTILITSLFTLTLIASGLWYMSDPLVTQAEATEEPAQEELQMQVGRYVVINLDTKTLELHDGTTTITVLPILSQGKPGSYYETIGGRYINDYKVPLHFSSIGHVYMPYSVHLFGNYFIHGIPYYPNGNPVSSTYSGGCIRLTNENAEMVYNFVARGTPIIVTRDNEFSFNPTKKASTTLSSIEMTNLMVASISLEVLTQDNEISDIDGLTITTRRKLLSRLINSGDSAVARLYAQSLGEDTFISLMNQKAQALGLTNTRFGSIDQPVNTTYDDYARFMTYIGTYKSYLRTLK